MRHCLMLLIAGLAMTVLGCQAQENYRIELQDAHDALEGEFPELAEHHLQEAQSLAQENGLREELAAKLLLAEAKMQKGDLISGEKLAQDVLQASTPGTVERAQAHQILAKVAIRRGRLDTAMEQLNQARPNCQSETQRRQIDDLSALVEGLIAYGQGRTSEAEKHWKAIRNSELKFSIAAYTREPIAVVITR